MLSKCVIHIHFTILHINSYQWSLVQQTPTTSCSAGSLYLAAAALLTPASVNLLCKHEQQAAQEQCSSYVTGKQIGDEHFVSH